MSQFAPIRTKRLLIRQWRLSDLDDYHEGCNTPAVMRWLGGVQTRAAVRREIEFFIRAQARDGFTFWAVERLSDRRLLGFCGLLRIRESGCPLNGSIEIGWRIRQDAWRRGYAYEAASAVLDCAFATFRLHTIISRAASKNVASKALMRKLRMSRRRDLDYTPPDEEQELVVFQTTADQRARWRAWQVPAGL